MSTRNKGAIYQYPLENVAKALEAIRGGMPVLTASKTYQVPRSTLRSKLSGRAPEKVGKIGPESVLGKDVEERLVQWITSTAARGFPINKEALFFSVKKLVEESNMKTPFVNSVPGKKWFTSFLKRNPIVTQKHTEYVNKARASVTEEKIRNWFAETLELIGEEREVLNFPSRIWNMDESGIFLSPKGSLVQAEKGKSYDVTSTSEKDNLTTLIAANAAGEFAPPLTVYKYDRLPAAIMRSAPPNWSIGKSDTGWMQSETFFGYFANVFYPHLLKQQISLPVVVFVDGHASHLSLHLCKFCREKKIILICLYPNTTHIMQPLDVAFFFPLKQAWKKMCRKWIFDHNGQSIQKKDVPSALNSVLTNSNFQQSIAAGFKASGLYPFDPEAVNYSKCISQSQRRLEEEKETNTSTSPTHDLMFEHFKFIESNINNSLLQKFKETFKNRLEWTGDISYLKLYEFWCNIKNKICRKEDEQQLQESSGSNVLNDFTVGVFEVIEEDLIDFPFPEFDSARMDITLTNELNTSVVNEKIKTAVVKLGGGDNDEPKQESAKINVLQNIVLVPPSVCNIQNQDEVFPKAEDTTQTEVHGELNDVVEAKPIKVKSLAEILEGIIPIPEMRTPTTTKRKREILPPVLTSEKWMQIAEAKEQEKTEKENNKKARKAKKDAVQLKQGSVLKEQNGSTTKDSKKEIKKLAVGSFVILKYENEFYPAKILKVQKDQAFCSSMVKFGMKWKWPEKADTLWYPCEDLLEIISPPVNANSRGAFKVVEMDKYE